MTAAEADYLAWERRRSAVSFARECIRRARLKRRLDCGHTVDGSEPYRYQVWRFNLDPPGVSQRTDCEQCARVDLRG